MRESERLSYWRDAVCRNLNGITCRGTDGVPFSGRLVAKNADDHVVATLSGGRHRAIRTEKARRELGDDFFVLFYQLEGRMGVALNDTELEIGPNEFYYYDSRHNHQLIFESTFRHIAIRVPRAKLRAGWPELSQMGSFRFAAANDPMSALIGSNIRTLAGMSCALSAPQVERAVDTVLGLFSATLQDHRQGVEGLGGDLYARAIGHIRRHVADEALTAATIAGALGISRRYLDKLFHDRGETVGQHVRRSRLDRCATELRSPAGQSLSIADIAFGWGFQNAAHFSKVFRSEYGMSPRAYRAMPRAAAQSRRSGTEK